MQKCLTGENLQLCPGWLRLGDLGVCVWGFPAAAEGTWPAVNVECPGSSRGPVSCWRGTRGSAAGSPAHACPASSGPAGLWLPAGCCSSLCKRSDQAAEETHQRFYTAKTPTLSSWWMSTHTQSMTICPIWATVPSGPVSSSSFFSNSAKWLQKKKKICISSACESIPDAAL